MSSFSSDPCASRTNLHTTSHTEQRSSGTLLTLLTFGIELERIVVAPKDVFKNILPQAVQAFAPVCLTHMALLDAGVPTLCGGLICQCPQYKPDCIESHYLDCKSDECVQRIKGLCAAKSANTRGTSHFGRWHVDVDDSAKLTDVERSKALEGEYETYSLELGSPCFTSLTTPGRMKLRECLRPQTTSALTAASS